MKLLIIVGASFFEKEIKGILDSADISVYSQTNIMGHSDNKNEDLLENWFAVSNEYQKSVMFFSFTGSAKAQKVLERTEEYNATIDSKSRLRAFILSVENHI